MPKGMYVTIMESLFFEKYSSGMDSVEFTRNDIVEHAVRAGFARPKNLGDLVYSFRYRTPLPESIKRTAPDGYSWVIIGTGNAKYKFVLSKTTNIMPNRALRPILVPNNTPEIITMYSLSDEQSLLSMVRYNRILDMFLGVVAYSMQNHLRTKVDEIGQIEIDELYIAINKAGQHFIIPVQAKVGNDKIGAVQLYQNIQFCSKRFPHLICVPIAVHFENDSNSICMFRLALDDFAVQIIEEKHYRLSDACQITSEYVCRNNTEITPLLLE